MSCRLYGYIDYGLAGRLEHINAGTIRADYF